MSKSRLRIVPRTELLEWDRRQVALVATLAVLTATTVFPAVWVVRELFDTWIPAGDRRAALIGCVGLFVIRAATAAFTVMQRQAAMRLAKDAAAKLRVKLGRGVLEADPRAFDQLVPARVQSRITQETERLDVMLNRLASVVMLALATAVLAGVGMVLVSPVLTAVAVGVVLIALLGHKRHIARVREKTRKFQDAFEKYAVSTAFLVRQAGLIKTRGFKEGELRRQAGVIAHLRHRGLGMANAHVQAGQVQSVTVSWMAVAALAVGAQQVIAGGSSLGDLAAFYFAAALQAQAIVQIVSARPEVMAGRLALDRLSQLWASLQPVEHRDGRSFTGTTARIELRDITVTYDERVVLHGVDLRLQPGEHVDVHGSNGAGKTTLLRVLMGLLPPASGKVLIDGDDLSELAGDTVRQKIGLAPQRPTFFDDSILENLTYGRPDASVEEVRWALRLVGLEQFVDSLPGGVHSPIGDEAVRLSGGEAQRASIARALIGRPDLLVLDEPGNHLPEADLSRILAEIRRALPSTTIVTVGHHHTGALPADKSLVLQDGILQEPAVHG